MAAAATQRGQAQRRRRLLVASAAEGAHASTTIASLGAVRRALMARDLIVAGEMGWLKRLADEQCKSTADASKLLSGVAAAAE